MNYFISPNFLMIEVILTPSSGTTVAITPFLEQQQLLNRPIVAIETFSNLDMTYSPLSSNVLVIPVAMFNAASLSINRAGNQAKGPGAKTGLYYKNMPLSMLRRMRNNYTGLNPSPSNGAELFRCQPMFIQWPDSTINFNTPVAQAAIYSVPIGIHYLLEGQDPTPYIYQNRQH